MLVLGLQQMKFHLIPVTKFTSPDNQLFLLCAIICRAAPVVTVEADILAPREPLVLNDLPEENVCVVEGDTTVVCFNVSTCFNYSLLSGDSVEEFSKKHIQCIHMTQYCVTVQGSL